MSDYFKGKKPISKKKREELERAGIISTKSAVPGEKAPVGEEAPTVGQRVDPSTVGMPGKVPTEENIQQVASQIAQDMSFNTLDDIIEQMSPEKAEKFRKVLEKGWEEQPMAMGAASLLAPNPATIPFKAVKGAGLGSKAARYFGPEAATSVGYQAGEGELGADLGTLGRTAAETLGGKALESGASRLLKGKPGIRRAKSLGYGTQELRKSRSKYGDRTPEEFLQETMEELEDLNLFGSGNVEFDAKKLKFVPKGSEAGGKLFPPASQAAKPGKSPFPPSQKEIRKRLKEAKKKTYERMEEVLDQKAPIPLQERIVEGGEMSPKVTGKFTPETLEEATDASLRDFVNEITVEEGINQDVAQRSFNRLFQGADEITISDLNEEKKRLYQTVNYEGTPPSGGTVMARKKLANIYSKAIDEAVDDPELKQLNKTYENLSNVSEPLEARMEERVTSPSPGRRASEQALFVGPKPYRGLRTAEALEDPFFGPSAQFGMEMRKSPGTQEYIRGKGAQIIPEATRQLLDEGQDRRVPYDPEALRRSPQSVDRVRNLPFALQNTRLPRTTQGILENIPLVKAKVAQELPEMYPEVKRVLEHRPQDIDRLLPNLIQAVPELFEPDEYGRVDNKILDPATKMKAIDEIYSDPDISNTERVEMVDRLMRTGKLEGYK